MDRELEKGDVILAALPRQTPTGHEQQGTRPFVIVGLIPGRTRYKMAVGAPLTTRTGTWFEMNSLVYPILQAGTGNLRRDSVVLLDQIRAIDARRIEQYIGRLNEEAYLAISAGINRIFG